MPEPVVFWDIDGTIVTPSMESLFIRYLRRNSLMSYWHTARSYLRLLPSSQAQQHRLKLAYLCGIPETTVVEWMKDCFQSDIVPRLSRPCLDAIRALSEGGISQVLLSGTPSELARCLAGRTEIEHVIAAQPEVAEGRYTGRLIEPHPFAGRKVRFAESWLQAHQRSWSETVVIADHWQDRFVLGRAALAIVVNPAYTTRKLAHSEGWIVLSSRDGTLCVPDITSPILEFASS